MIWILVSGVALVIVYELIAAWPGTQAQTISRIIWEWNKRWPVIPFAFGILMGHLFL